MEWIIQKMSKIMQILKQVAIQSTVYIVLSTICGYFFKGDLNIVAYSLAACIMFNFGLYGWYFSQMSSQMKESAKYSHCIQGQMNVIPKESIRHYTQKQIDEYASSKQSRTDREEYVDDVCRELTRKERQIYE